MMSVRKVAVSASAACALAAAFGACRLRLRPACGHRPGAGYCSGSLPSSGRQAGLRGRRPRVRRADRTSHVRFETSAEQVLVCKPIFVTQDGSEVRSRAGLLGEGGRRLGPGAPLRGHLGASGATGAGLRQGPARHRVAGERRAPLTWNCSAMAAGTGRQLVESVSMQTSRLRAGGRILRGAVAPACPASPWRPSRSTRRQESKRGT